MPRAHDLALIATLALGASMAAATLLPLPPGPGIPGSDKTHHLLGFAALTLPLAATRPRALVWLVPILAVYGGVIELVQPLVGRGRELEDWLADLAGIGLGVLVGGALGGLWRRRS